MMQLSDYLYHDEPAGQIYCGDCLEILPLLPPVDLVLTDPPYGIGLDYGGSFEDNEEYIKINAPKWHGLLRPLLTNNGLMAVTCGVKNITLWPKSDWVGCWYYKSYDSRCPFGFNQWQPILLYGKDRTVHLGCRPDVIDKLESSQKNGHPCPKPLSFIRKVISRFEPPLGSIILDPFLGSGTTAVAAKQLGRKFIGIEIEPKYCDIAVERLKQEVLDLC